MIIEISPPNPLPGETQEMSITMANTIFGALSKARPINWGRLIQKLVEKSIPHIGKKPSPLSLYILHLYQQNLCVNEAEEDAWTIAKDEFSYKLAPEIEQTEAWTKVSLSDSSVSKLPPAAPTLDSKKTTASQPGDEVGPSREPHLRDIDLSSFEYLETPFNQVRGELTNLQNQYFWLEHITRV